MSLFLNCEAAFLYCVIPIWIWHPLLQKKGFVGFQMVATVIIRSVGQRATKLLAVKVTYTPYITSMERSKTTLKNVPASFLGYVLLSPNDSIFIVFTLILFYKERLKILYSQGISNIQSCFVIVLVFFEAETAFSVLFFWQIFFMFICWKTWLPLDKK